MQIGQSCSADKSDGARAPSPLAVPFTIAKWWKNRRRNESVHVTLSEYEGRSLVSIRVYATGADGIDRPTTKGISMDASKLPTLVQSMVKAEAKARELGLLGSGDAAA